MIRVTSHSNVIFLLHPFTLSLLKIKKIIGMCGMFSGLIRLPLTAVIVVFEMVSSVDVQTSLAVPMLCSSVVAYFVAVELEPEGLWEQIVKQDGINIDFRHIGNFHLEEEDG